MHQDMPEKEDSKVEKPKGFGKLDRKRKLQLMIGGVIGLMILVTAGLFAATRSPDQVAGEPSPSPTPTSSPTPTELASNLDGVLVAPDLATRHPLGVMIENHTLARPQTGLADANIVYESIVEGGITRFMAVYGHTTPERVGPVRSARTQFLDFAQEYTPNSAYYAHVGGSEGALNKIKIDKIYDLDQFSIGTKAYRRFPKVGLATEHTMYAFPKSLFDVARDRGYAQNSDFRSWKFKDDASVENRPETQTITIPFSSAQYQVKYVYDKLTNSYKRFMANSEHKDAASGKQISPKNVVIHFADYRTINSKGVQGVATLGSGTAKILRDGKVIEAKWQKASVHARTIYTDAASGAEIEFNRGQFFIEIPKTGTTITVE